MGLREDRTVQPSSTTETGAPRVAVRIGVSVIAIIGIIGLQAA